MIQHNSTSHPWSPQTPQQQEVLIRRCALVGILGNILLSAFKLFAGIAGQSGAMLSDAVHSLSDVFATAIALLGTRLSQKEADREHPYGHERFECVASLALGLILLVTGLGIGKAGVDHLLQGSEALAVPGGIALAAAVVSIVSKEAMFWYTRRCARLLNSAVFLADAWHHRSDALSSIGSLAGIGGAMLGFPLLDPLASVVICLFILKAAAAILKDALSKLLDTACGEELEQALRRCISSQPDVVAIDAFRSRMFGSRVYLDLELQVDGELPLRAAHAVAQRIHDQLEQSFPELKHVMIHLNPAPQGEESDKTQETSS